MQAGVVGQSVAVGQFEGPLGLLLELVESGRLEVSTVSVGYITARYLALIAQLDVSTPEELSDFVELGSRLLYIKSLSLLPSGPETQLPQELTDLNRELAEYRRMQLAAKSLAGLASRRTWPRSAVERLDPSQLPYPSVGPNQLADTFAAAIARVDARPKPPVVKQHLRQEVVIARIKRQLAEGSFTLETLLDRCRDRLEVIVLFVALLELWRDGTVRVVQNAQFAPIQVEPASA